MKIKLPETLFIGKDYKYLIFSCNDDNLSKEHAPTCFDEKSAPPGYMKCPVKACTYCLPTVGQRGKCAREKIKLGKLKQKLNSHLA